MKKTSLIFLTLIFTTVYTYAQEFLTPPSSNPVIKQRLSNRPASNKAARMMSVNDTIKLPFVDDFSGSDIYPDQQWWTDSSVFVNTGFGINQPTVGVATFDGVDKYGNAYVFLPGAYGSADTLTSVPIDLFESSGGDPYDVSDSLTLSFFYERKGMGDAPEAGDSLFLEFYDIANSTWNNVWSADGGSADLNFSRVFIPITDSTSYFKKGFRFRFRNYGSLAGLIDQWQLDYVILKENIFSSDTIINDVTLVNPGFSLINGFTSVPWTHYNSLSATAKSQKMKWTFSTKLTNLNNQPKNVSGDNSIYDQYGTNVYTNIGTNTISLNPGDSVYNYDISPYVYDDPSAADSSFFIWVNSLNTGGLQDFNKHNDTVRYVQKFFNYYSYDDGSAESGYSLANSPAAQMAMKFHTLKADTLQAVAIHFSQVSLNVSNKLMNLAVWNSVSVGTSTDDLRYQMVDIKPAYDDSINSFHIYVLDTPQYIGAGDIYVGLIQNSTFDLNLGFDRNIESNSNMFFNSTGNWTQSAIPGTWMIRPMFGKKPVFAGINDQPTGNDLSLYPNPANDKIFTGHTGNNGLNIRYSVYDLSGKMILNDLLRNNSIDVSSLYPGFYFIKLSDDHQQIKTAKLIISR